MKKYKEKKKKRKKKGKKKKRKRRKFISEKRGNIAGLYSWCE